jgi:uncharacterized repeat protein (TIGR01451 family)
MKRTAYLMVAVLGALTLMALAWNTVPVAAGPAAQVTLTPRPKLTPVPGTPAPPAPEEHAARVPRLRGTIFDWGRGNMPAGVQVVLSGDGWEASAETDASGEYVFWDLGNEVGTLNAVVPDARNDLIPYTSDVPVRIDPDREWVVNLALHAPDLVPEPLIGLEIVSSASEAEAGDNVSYNITVANNWSGGINQVMVVDDLPAGLSYVNATTSQGSVAFDRSAVWADVGYLDEGATVTVTILAKVDAEAETGTVLTNRVSAYHSENIAVQEEASLEVVDYANGALPVTGWTSTLPLALVFLGALTFFALRARRDGA